MYKNRVYYCYSNAQRKYINLTGINWIDKGIHEVSGKPFWVFEQNAKFGEVLERYKLERESILRTTQRYV